MSEQVEKSVSEVQSEVLARIECITGEEDITLADALGRVLASDVISPINVPAHDNSAMDGYAIRSEAYGLGQREFRIIGKVLAGQVHDLRPALNEAVRITTGAVMPPNCDMVVIQEVSTILGDMLHIPDGQEAGQNRRLRGEDLSDGQPALFKGRTLRPADLGLIASLGIVKVRVMRRLKVAFFSTGDEICSLGEAPGPGQVFDSNRFTLRGMLTRLGFELIDLGVVKDSPQALEAAIRTAAAQADVIFSSGGVSVGEADYTKDVMRTLGDVEFWRIAMRPGRPMAFGQVLGKPYFGLPGNPVAVMVTFYFFARLPLLKRAGAALDFLPRFRAALRGSIRKKPGRVEYQRAILSTSPSGELEVRLTGQQGSGVLRSMSEANAFVVMGHENGSAKDGDLVQCVAFDGLI